MKGPQIPLEDPDKMGIWRYGWMFHLARLRLSLSAVCIMSRNKGIIDFHDYPDSTTPQPWHFSTHICKRCGKEYTI